MGPGRAPALEPALAKALAPTGSFSPGPLPPEALQSLMQDRPLGFARSKELLWSLLSISHPEARLVSYRP